MRAGRVRCAPGLWAVAVGLMGVPLAAAQSSDAPGASERSSYPGFKLPTVDGGWLELSALRGRKTLLIHFASW